MLTTLGVVYFLLFYLTKKGSIKCLFFFQSYPGKAKINVNIPSASPSSTGELSLKSSPSMSPGNSIKKSPAAAATSVSTTPGNAHLNHNFTGNHHNNTNNGAALVDDNNKNTNKKISPTINKEVPTITIKVNKSWNLGPYLDPYKVTHLPEQFGQGPIHKVVRESVQKLVDASLDQKEVFGMLRQGEGRVIITASFEDKIQKVRLLAMESESDVKDFFEILFEELRCEPFYEVFKEDFVDPEDEPLKNGLLKRKNSSNEVTLTFSNSMPTLTAQAVNHPENTASSSSTPKIPRLSNMESSTTTNNGFFRENGSKPNKSSKVMAYHQQQRPRGRPPGAKNKVPPEAKQARSPKHIPTSSSPSRNNTNTSITTNNSPSNVTNNSNSTNPIITANISPKVSKSGPIYQNAYKLHLEQEKAKALKEAATAMKQQQQQQRQQQQQQQQQTPEHTSTSVFTTATIAMDGVQVEPSPPVLKAEEIIIPKDPTSWNIDHVIRYIGDLDPTLLPHVECFRSQEIDGNALLLLTMEMMMKYMGMKLGPALKICNIINKLLGKKYQPIPKFD